MRIFFHEKVSQKGQFVPAAAGWCLAHTMVKKVMELHLNFYALAISYLNFVTNKILSKTCLSLYCCSDYVYND